MRAEIAWLLLLVPLACGHNTGTALVDSGSGLPLPSPALDPESACLDITAAEAAYEVACHRLSPSDVGDAGSGYVGAHCAAATVGPRAALFDAGKLAYSANAVGCVTRYLGTLPCNAGSPALNPACGQVAWGVLGKGDSCDDVYSCGAGLYCLRDTPLSPCGTCASDVAEGDTCGPAANGALCASGDCNGGTCRAAAQQGAACDLNTAVCAQGLSCQAVGCEPPHDAGALCNSALDCYDGLVCGVFSSQCQPAPEDGGACAIAPCAYGLACAQQSATCAPLVAGGACVQTDAGLSCPELEGCRDGGCVPVSLPGGPCGRSQDCALGIRSDGFCALLPAGQACGRDADCESQRCDAAGSGTCAASCG